MKPRSFLYVTAVFLCAPALCAASTVVVPHVAGNGWTTTLSVYNPSATGQSFTYTPYSDGGAAGTTTTHAVPGLGTIDLYALADLSGQGSGRVEASGPMVFTLRYRYGDSLSVCDFTLSEASATGWLLPNPDLDWFSWVGLALVNSNPTAATVTLRAFKNGSVAGTKTLTLPAQAKTSGLSTELWGLAPSGVDWMHVECGASISAPIVISGTTDQDRHLFGAGVPIALNLSFSDVSEVLLPGGEYAMGDHYGFVDPSHPSDELPIHTVKINSLYMATTPTTNKQYLEFLNDALANGLVEVRNYAVYAVGGSDVYYYTNGYAPYYSISYSGGAFSIADFRAGHPVVGAMWCGAAAYCNWLSLQNGLQECYNLKTWACDFTKNGYRLPTEAEWEYAARGGQYAPYYNYPWGNDQDVTKANWPGSKDPYEGTAPSTYPWTTPVGFYNGDLRLKSDYNWPGSASSYQTTNGANAFGLYDMAGNVWQLVNDWYGNDYYSKSPYDNPKGPDSGFVMPDGKAYRGMRGGNWYNGYATTGVNDGHSRVSNRNPSYYRGPQDPNHPWYHVGFRVARSSSASSNTSTFTLSSEVGTEGGTLPAEYSCDGAGSSPALSWSNAPAGTKEFALLMTTLPGDGTTKWNWVLYSIPGTTTHLDKNSSGVGVLGVGSDGPTMAYQPPCSKGPGAKVYTFTLYALSASPSLPSQANQVTGAALAQAISSITIGSASLNLSYARP